MTDPILKIFYYEEKGIYTFSSNFLLTFYPHDAKLMYSKSNNKSIK